MASASFVVDSSVLTKLFLNDEDLVEEARALFEYHADNRVELIAPFPVYYEVPSAILKAMRAGRIERGYARQAIDLFVSLTLPIVTPTDNSLRDMVSESYDLAEQLSRSFYDAIFVSTAQRLDLPLLTADKRLFDAASTVSLPVAWLGDLELP